ncbi:LAGLIDADG family homing endonuclease [archaeon]|nr:LAGLIDADG family homing endonuclease [archaeon]
MFDLFKLYNPKEDIGPRSHVRCKGKNLTLITNELINEMITKEDKIFYVSKRIAKKLNLNNDTPLKMFRKRNEWFSIAVLKELLNEWKIICKKSNKNFLNKKNQIINSIEYLSSGTSKTIILKAVKINNIIFAQIAGAHHADGCLFKEFTKNGVSYKFQILDYYKGNLEYFERNFSELFGIKLKIKKDKQNSWSISIRNKIFGRYLEIFYEFPTGNKTYFNLPKIIKKSNLNIKKNYIQGFITFDGCVENDKTISLGIANKELIEEFYTIFKNLGYKIKKIEKKGYFHLKTPVLNRKEILLWKKLFGERTEKQLKLNSFIQLYKDKIKNFNEAMLILNKYFPKQNSSKISIIDIIISLKNLRECNKYELANKTNIGVSTLYRYIHILEKSNILKRKSKNQKYPNKLYFYYNPYIKEWRLPNYLS